MSRRIRVAAAQYEPRVGDPDHNLSEAVRWTDEAMTQGAQLVVLPELASSGYVFEGESEADVSAESPTTGPMVRGLRDVCARHDGYVVTGINERGGDCRYNSAVVIGPNGPLATYRKLHLFYDEKSWFEPGAQLTLVDLPFGRLGMIICFDLWFPEPARALAVAGAEIIAVPTNWVASFKRTVWDDRGYCQGDYIAMATAAQNSVVMVCADRIGVERGTTFLGASIIVGPDGWPVAGPASRDQPELLMAEVDLDDVELARQRTPRNDLLEDRRPGAYTVVEVAPDPVSTTAGA
ncbi:MAG TPA: nitrilase-related carbon-nitrogen hydrolase [Candidatus Acidoferrales bacterium]|jgi:N-carbamoylputrescine amidase|nr:nitrilase-related carbon-nitrogen hydrolase [Candidatus Acidoferrales bacterium]